MMIKVAVFYVLCAQVFGQNTVDNIQESEPLINQLHQLMDTIVSYSKKIEIIETKLAGCDKRLDDYGEKLDGQENGEYCFCKIL